MFAGADGHLSRIAVVRMLPGLGDLLCAVPALQGLRAAQPDANITLIGRGSSRWFAHRYSSLIDDWLGCDWCPGLVESTDDPAALDAFLDTARQRSFDLAIQMHGDGRATNAFTASLGASRWGGLSRAPTSGGSTALIDDAAHEVDRCVEAVRAAQIDITPGPGGFPVEPTDRLPVGVGEGPFAVVHAGASRPDRRWPAEWFSAVAALLAARIGCVALTGGRYERSLTALVRDGLDAGARRRVVDLAGQTRLGTLAALLTRSTLVVANDTGVAHLAAAVGAPTVTIFGGPHRRRWEPRGRWTVGVGVDGAWPPVDDVLTAVDTVLGVPC